MPLLKNDNQPPIAQPHKLTISDGWRFGIGLWLALLVGMPIILAVSACALWAVLWAIGIEYRP